MNTVVYIVLDFSLSMFINRSHNTPKEGSPLLTHKGSLVPACWLGQDQHRVFPYSSNRVLELFLPNYTICKYITRMRTKQLYPVRRTWVGYIEVDTSEPESGTGCSGLDKIYTSANMCTNLPCLAQNKTRHYPCRQEWLVHCEA